jgi:hypothetical protein
MCPSLWSDVYTPDGEDGDVAHAVIVHQARRVPRPRVTEVPQHRTNHKRPNLPGPSNDANDMGISQ